MAVQDDPIKVLVGCPGQEQLRLIKAGGGNHDAEMFRDAPDGPEMVVVPAGSFMMGAARSDPDLDMVEVPSHNVTIVSPFAVGRHAVTRGQFAAFVEATGYNANGGSKWVGSKFENDPKTSWRNPGFEQSDTHPVVCVSWVDAKAYVAWLTEITDKAYSLPTEAEWEYSARAGTTTPVWCGMSITREQANYGAQLLEKLGRRDPRRGTEPVGNYAANPWGLYNVYGNVWEWCEDVFHLRYSGAPSDGSAWLDGGMSSRVVRGGSWIDASAQRLRSASRASGTADERTVHKGFRVVRSLGAHG